MVKTSNPEQQKTSRAVREYEMRGVAGIHIEDQVSPKRCGHLDGKEVIPREEFVSKISAAVGARSDKDFLIVARTDSRAVISFDDAVARANKALGAGADMAFVEAVQDMDELLAVPRRVEGPCLYNMAVGGKTPIVSFADAQQAGYRLAILPGLLMIPVIKSVDRALREAKETGQAQPQPPKAPATKETTIQEYFQRFGSGKWDALRKTYSST